MMSSPGVPLIVSRPFVPLIVHDAALVGGVHTTSERLKVARARKTAACRRATSSPFDALASQRTLALPFVLVNVREIGTRTSQKTPATDQLPYSGSVRRGRLDDGLFIADRCSIMRGGKIPSLLSRGVRGFPTWLAKSSHQPWARLPGGPMALSRRGSSVVRPCPYGPGRPTEALRCADVPTMGAAELQTEIDQLERGFREWVRKGMATPSPSFDGLRDCPDY